MAKKVKANPKNLTPYLSEIGVWALSIGCSIGWGSFVVTSSSYLSRAGVWGSIIGLIVGAFLMIFVARNYHFMINCFPDAGGVYTYAKEVFGFDHGFLAAWFLFLTYIAVFWANVASLPLFANYFVGGILKVGFHYTIFGYDIYLGEAVLSVIAIILTIAFCTRSRKAVMNAMIGMALFFCVGIIGVFGACLIKSGTPFWAPDPGFVPDASVISQTFLVASISPWAFIGFENVSHSASEYKFSRTKVFRILVGSIVVTVVLYATVMLMSTIVYPERYSNWLAYISDLNHLSGLEALPAFYVADRLMGYQGVTILMLSLLCLIITSLIGNVVALSRLLYSMAKDAVLPKQLTKLNDKGTPYRSLILIGIVSLIIPFLGRTAIGWIVDVTTIGAILIYAIVSGTTFTVARARGNKVELWTGIIGFVGMVSLGAYFLFAGIVKAHSMSPESYFLLAGWGLLGFLALRVILSRDKERRFGRSTVAWVGLLGLVMFSGFAWMNERLINVEERAQSAISSLFEVGRESPDIVTANRDMIQHELGYMDHQRLAVMAAGALLFGIALALLLTNYSHVSRWAQESDERLTQARNAVYTNPVTGLSSMAHFTETAPELAEKIFETGNSPTLLAFSISGLKDFAESRGVDQEHKVLRAFADRLTDTFGKESCAHAFDDCFFALVPISRAEEQVKGIFTSCSVVPDLEELPIRAGAYTCTEEDDIAVDGVRRAQEACGAESKEWNSALNWYDDQKSRKAKMRSYILRNVDKAVENRWIRPYYQAEVDAEKHEVCGKEALARWVDPEMGFLSPGDFIPVLEEAGLLYRLDMHMVDCVLADAAVMEKQGITNVPTSINISLADLDKVDVISEIAKKADAAGVDRSTIHIELTESVAVNDAVTLKDTIARMHENGFEVWMDDFGSGYSSLNSLKDFEFDVLKLDMEFISDESNPKTWEIIKGVVAMGRQIGMTILAEGVETENQADKLREAGVEMLQGYFFSKPLPIDEIAKYYQEDDNA